MDAVDMGKPILKPELVPTTLAATKDGVAIDSPFKLKVSSSSQEYTYGEINFDTFGILILYKLLC